MKKRSFLRAIKVAVKLYLDRIRPYPFIMRVLPQPKNIAMLLGSIIHQSAKVQGRLILNEPAWFQMNKDAVCSNVNVSGMNFCYIGERSVLSEMHIDRNTFVLKDRIVQGVDRITKEWTISVDLEGAYASGGNRSKTNFYINELTAQTAGEILDIFSERGINTIWYIVGSLFEDPVFRKICERLMSDPSVEVGWHTQNHINYFFADKSEVEKDLLSAQKIRNQFGIKMNQMAFPYNAVGYVEDVTDAGFNKLRGYIGQFYLPRTIDFDLFSFYGTSLFIGPQTIENCFSTILNKIKLSNMNMFLHPIDWIYCDLSRFRCYIDKVIELKRQDKLH